MTNTESAHAPLPRIADVAAAAATTFASDDRITAVYYHMPFGQVVAVRDGSVYLAAEYDAGKVGR